MDGSMPLPLTPLPLLPPVVCAFEFLRCATLAGSAAVVTAGATDDGTLEVSDGGGCLCSECVFCELPVLGLLASGAAEPLPLTPFPTGPVSILSLIHI